MTILESLQFKVLAYSNATTADQKFDDRMNAFPSCNLDYGT